MAISRTTRTALDLLDALRVPGRIDPSLARHVAMSLRLFLDAGTFGSREAIERSRATALRLRARDATAPRSRTAGGALRS